MSLWESNETIGKNKMNQKTLYMGSAEPTDKFVGMLWFDTDTGIIKFRNLVNDAWIDPTVEGIHFGIGDIYLYYLSGDVLNLDNALLNITRQSDILEVFYASITEEDYPRLTIYSDGRMLWSNGTDIGDVTLIRDSAGYLRCLNNFGALSLKINNTEVISSARVLANVTANAGIITSGTFDQARIPWTLIPASGIIIGGDVTAYREAANILAIDDQIKSIRSAGADWCFAAKTLADTIPKLIINAFGQIWFSDGASSWDVQILRYGANILQLGTDDSFFLQSNNYLQFRDSTLKIMSDNDGELDIKADDSVNVQAPSIYLPIFGTDYGCVLYLSLEEGTGTIAYDESPIGNDGTLIGATHVPTWIAGKFGEAVRCDGVDDYIEVPTNTALDVSTWTISIWCKLLAAPVGVEANMLARRNAGNNQGICWTVAVGTQAVYFYVRDSVGWKSNSWTFPDLTNWYHIVQTCDGTNITLYINGVQYDQDACGVNVIPTGVVLRLGCDTRAVQLFTNMDYDEFRFYNRVLTAAEIRTHYLNCKGRYTRGIIVSNKFRFLGTDLTPDISVIGGHLIFGSGNNIVLSTTTGTKIGTATNQLLAFYNQTPCDQPATVSDASDLATCITSINAIIDRLQELGLIA